MLLIGNAVCRICDDSMHVTQLLNLAVRRSKRHEPGWSPIQNRRACCGCGGQGNGLNLSSAFCAPDSSFIRLWSENHLLTWLQVMRGSSWLCEVCCSEWWTTFAGLFPANAGKSGEADARCNALHIVCSLPICHTIFTSVVL